MATGEIVNPNRRVKYKIATEFLFFFHPVNPLSGDLSKWTFTVPTALPPNVENGIDFHSNHRLVVPF